MNLKRLFGLTLTIPALILLAPVFGLTALLVRLKLDAPVIFRQERPGRYGQPFSLFKFRTVFLPGNNTTGKKCFAAI
jgi:sugar transferase EpsL